MSANSLRPKWMNAFEARNITSPMKENEPRGRNAFNRDFGTIVHSNFFKRLAHKTQVYSLPYNDHIHTRLTHSVEASQIGREISRYFARSVLRRKVDFFSDSKYMDTFEREIEELTAAACLGHDIGHSPFGHVGKKTIEKFCEDRKQSHIFDDNKQVVRILLNDKWFEKIKVSGPFVASILKKDNLGGSCYPSETDKLTQILTQLNLLEGRHPCSVFMEAADDIAYLSADLLDFISIYSGSGTFANLEKFELFKDLLLVDGEGKPLTGNLKTEFIGAIEGDGDEVKQDFSDSFLKIALAHVFAVIDTFSGEFISGRLPVGSPTIENLPGAFYQFLVTHASEKDGKKDPNLLYSKCIGSEGQTFFNLKNKIYYGAILNEEFISEQDKLAKVVINSLLSELFVLTTSSNVLTESAFRKLPSDAQNYLLSAIENGNLFQAIVDLVSGMTDRYAISLWKDLAGLSALERMSGKPFKKTG